MDQEEAETEGSQLRAFTDINCCRWQSVWVEDTFDVHAHKQAEWTPYNGFDKERKALLQSAADGQFATKVIKIGKKSAREELRHVSRCDLHRNRTTRAACDCEQDGRCEGTLPRGRRHAGPHMDVTRAPQLHHRVGMRRDRIRTSNWARPTLWHARQTVTQRGLF